MAGAVAAEGRLCSSSLQGDLLLICSGGYEGRCGSCSSSGMPEQAEVLHGASSCSGPGGPAVNIGVPWHCHARRLQRLGLACADIWPVRLRLRCIALGRP